MPNPLTDTAELLLLDLINGVTSTAPVTAPLRLALLTAQGTDAAPGTEVNGGGYARQALVMAAAVNGSASNSAAVSFANMPACTVVGFAIYDSAGSPKRLWDFPASAARTYAAGDTATVAVGQITLALD